MLSVCPTKKFETFWKRIIENYNTYRGNLSERSNNQLKSRWPKIHYVVQKFNGCYKQVVALKKNSYTENDVIVNVYAIWKDDLAYMVAVKRST